MQWLYKKSRTNNNGEYEGGWFAIVGMLDRRRTQKSVGNLSELTIRKLHQDNVGLSAYGQMSFGFILKSF